MIKNKRVPPRFRLWLLSLGVALGVLCPGGAWAKDEAVPDEIIVRLGAGVDIAPLLVKHQLSLIGRFGSRPIYRLRVIGNAKLKDKMKALGSERGVRSVDENVSYQVLQPDKNVAWAIGDPQAFSPRQWAGQAIRLPEAHRVATGKGVRVAVLDTGVDLSHPALAGRLLPGFDFVDWDADPSEVYRQESPSYGHGTHVAGLVALSAPDARIIPVRILDAQGYGNAWVLAEAMLYAVDPDGNPDTDDGAHVINLSVGSPLKTELFKTVAKLVTCKKRDSKESDKDDDGDDDSGDDEDAFSLGDKARCSGFGGAIVIAAAGNGGSDKLREYPAAESSSSLLSVGASEADGWLAPFSNFGWVKLAAPGDGITSTVPGGGYGTWSGTSMAAPLVSGAAALLRSIRPDLAADKVVKRLKDLGSKICGTSMKQLDVLAVVSDEERRDKPSCKKKD